MMLAIYINQIEQRKAEGKEDASDSDDSSDTDTDTDTDDDTDDDESEGHESDKEGAEAGNQLITRNEHSKFTQNRTTARNLRYGTWMWNLSFFLETYMFLISVATTPC